jgi:hypothetical protein
MYYRTIPSNLSVDAIASLIADEEAGAAQFVENKVAPIKTSATPASPKNVAKFIERDDDIPKVPVMVLHGDSIPDGKKVDWSGAMLVKGTMKIVDLCR